MLKQLQNQGWILCLTLSVVIFSVPNSGYGQPSSTWTEDRWSFIDEENGTRSDPTGAVVLMDISPDLNVALDKPAIDYKGEEAPVTDGSVTRSKSWRSMTEDAINFFLLIDLERNRLVNRVRILPLRKDESMFMKGYSIQLSSDNVVFDEVILNKFNVDPLIDTTFTPTLARYVKVQVKAIDRVNEVWVGDVEVYSEGKVSQGVFFSSVTDLGVRRDKNFGLASWEADLPEGTDLSLQFRSGDSRTPDENWSEWSEELRASDGTLFEVLEPRRHIQFRANLTSEDPNFTPRLKKISIDFSDPLVRRASAAVRREVILGDTLASNEALVGEETDFVYTIKTDLDIRSLGFDQIAIFAPSLMSVKKVEINGSELPKERYTVRDTNLAVGHRVTLSLDEPVKDDAELSIGFAAKLFDEINTFPSQFRNSIDAPDNPQLVEAESEGSLVILTKGIMESVLEASKVKVAPNPFSPNGDGIFDFTEIRYELAKLSLPRGVRIRIFNLSGDVVREFKREQKSGVYMETWDGMDDDGDLVPPGLYIYQIDVDLKQKDAVVNGAVVVAY